MQHDNERPDWGPLVAAGLQSHGYALIPQFVEPTEASQLANLIHDDGRFRKTVDMGRSGYGRGTYRYFCEPVPPTVARLQSELYELLCPIVWASCTEWSASAFPENHAAFLDQCRSAGQVDPSPLILRYERGDFNRLHQDRYGPVTFPLQGVVMLSRRADYEGGYFVLLEHGGSEQPKTVVVEADQGDLIVFPNSIWPRHRARDSKLPTVLHGVSELVSGSRTTLGLILHNA